MSDSGGLEGIFRARSVAVVGASTNPAKTGHVLLRNIVDGGFGGEVYPVNPGAAEILGRRAYPNLSAIPGRVDLVVIAVPAGAVPAVIEEAVGLDVGGAVVISGGFAEAGRGDLEAALLAAARGGRLRVVGPNCQGFNYTPNRLCATWPLTSAAGPVAVISQSGTVSAALQAWAEEDGLGVSGAVSLGNKVDVNELELLEFFASDGVTRAVGLYLEGVASGTEFLRSARELSSRVRIAVLRPGLSPRGRKASESHTRSLAGDARVFRAVCRQAGVVPAAEVYELYDFCKIALAVRGPGPVAGGRVVVDPLPRRLAVVTSSGGCGILATDAAYACGLEVPDLEPEVAAALKEGLPTQCVTANPVDLTGDADAARFRAALAVLGRSRAADSVLAVFGDPIPGAAEVMSEAVRAFPGKLFVACYIGGGTVEKTETRWLNQGGIPAFPTPERAVRALASLRRPGYLAAAGANGSGGQTRVGSEAS